jgi:hypothetical protein
MEPRERAVHLVVERHVSEQAPSGHVFEDDLSFVADVNSPALAWIVTALALIVLGIMLLGLLLWAVVTQRDGTRQEDTSVQEEHEPSETSQPSGAPPNASGSDPVVPERELPAPELALLNAQPLRIGDEAEIRVASAPVGWIEFRAAAGPWSRLDGDVLRLTAMSDPLRVEVRACDVGASSPVAIWSYPVRPANRPPNLSVACQPGAPRVGETLEVLLASSDPDDDRVAVEYRIGADGPWEPAPLGHVVLRDLPAGPYTVSFRATDEFKLSSPVSERRWEVLPRRNRSPELLLAASLPRELWVGDHLHIDAYATDSDGDRTWVEISPDGASWRETFEPQLSLGPLEAGVVNVHLRAVDGAGASSAVLFHRLIVRRRPAQVVELGDMAGPASVASATWREPSSDESIRYRPTPQEQLFKRWRAGGLRTQRLNREESALRGGSRRF